MAMRLFWYKSVRPRSLTQLIRPLWFWLSIRGYIRNRKSTPHIVDTRSGRLCILVMRRVADSRVIQQARRLLSDSKSPILLITDTENSPYWWEGDMSTPHIVDTGRRWLPVSSVSLILGFDDSAYISDTGSHSREIGVELLTFKKNKSRRAHKNVWSVSKTA